jgi:hypothetical protein
MKKPLALAGAATAFAVLAPAWAHAAEPLLVQNLAPEIRSRCDGGRISAEGLRTAILGSKVAPLTSDRWWTADHPALIARAAFSNDMTTDGEALDLLQDLVESWVEPNPPSYKGLPRSSGGVSVDRPGGGPASVADGEAILKAVFAKDEASFTFGCDKAAEPKPSSILPGLRLSRTPEDLFDPLDTKSYGEFAYSQDDVADADAYSIYATAGWTFGEVRRQWPPNDASSYLAISATPVGFVQYEREGGDGVTADKEVNNLNFGLEAGGFIELGRPGRTDIHAYTLSLRAMSDDRLDSEAWSVNASFTPDIRLPGNHLPLLSKDRRLNFRWQLSAVADHASVSDPGRKVALQTAPEYTRIGYDFDAALRYALGGGASIALTSDYRLRDEVSRGDMDAQLFTAGLRFEPSPNWAFGLTYERGENLDSLEFSETWKLTIGVRR